MGRKFIFIFLVYVNFSYSQESKLKSFFEPSVNNLGIGLSYEQVISSKFTVHGQVKMTLPLLMVFFYTLKDDGVDFSNKYILYPEAKIEPRYYYRIKENSKVSNTGHFISLSSTYSFFKNSFHNFEGETISDFITIAPMWNIRTSLFRTAVSFEFGMGLGKSFIVNKAEAQGNHSFYLPVISLKIGYPLFGK